MIRRCCCNPTTPPGIKCNVCGGLCPYDAECDLFPPDSGPGLIRRCRVTTPNICCRTYTTTIAGQIAPIHCPSSCSGVRFSRINVSGGTTIGLTPISYSVTHSFTTPSGGGYCFVEPPFLDPAPTTYSATIPSCSSGGSGSLKMVINATVAFECAQVRLTIDATWSLASCSGAPNFLCQNEVFAGRVAFTAFYARTGWTGCPIAGTYNLIPPSTVVNTNDYAAIDGNGCTSCCDYVAIQPDATDVCGTPSTCNAEVIAAIAAQLPASVIVA